VRFRDHTSETNQFSYEELPADNRSGPAPARTSDEDVVLQLDFAPAGDGTFVLTLTATRFDDGMMLSQASRSGFVDAKLIGQISLMSTAHAGGTTARYWFQELQTGGEKIAEQPHSIGPIAGTLYSLNGSTLKLTAQFMPIGSTDPQRATLEKRAPGTSTWTRVQSVTIGDGYVALFQANDWKSDLPWDFRVTWATGTEQATSYPGRIRRDPKRARQLKVGIVNCAIHSFRLLTRKSSGAPELPGERFLGLYTRANLYFPYSEAATNLIRHNPDLLVAAGDQYYDRKLIPADYSGDILDALYRWCLWLLSFGALTRGRPTICLVDDHDVYQQNLWGWVGRAAPRDNFRYGGYTMPPTWINTVQRMQCSHNPDAYDPTPVQQGITVYYAAFSYGSVSFALLEDRKFKNTNQFGHDPSGRPLPPPRQLLGGRQENFLSAWVDMHPGQPKVCLTQTPYACIQTDPAGQPVSDPVSNGSPVPARRRAL
jgi:alkaline phosphatase D